MIGVALFPNFPLGLQGGLWGQGNRLLPTFCQPERLGEGLKIGKSLKVVRRGCKRSFAPRERKASCTGCKRLLEDLCGVGSTGLLHLLLTAFGDFPIFNPSPRRSGFQPKKLSTNNFQSEVGEVFGEIGGELSAKLGRRFSSFSCSGKSSEAFSTKTPPQISPSNFTTRFWVVAGPKKFPKLPGCPLVLFLCP